jgi:SAM-dependent methyltransferase
MGGRSAFGRSRVLDVGCAYGGFLVAAAEAGAGLLAGIDVDDGLLKLAKLQLADHRVAATLDRLDITSPGLVDRLGRFDVILCNDVLEHVVDPEAAAAHLAELLDEGGSLFLQIPNGWAVDFMIRDGHYGLFGITLLDRLRAERVWAGSYTDTYGVEHYAPLSYYLDILSRAGLSVRMLNQPPVDLEVLVEDLGRRFDDLQDGLSALSADEADPDLVEEMQRRGRHEIETFRHQAGLYRASTVEAERTIIARALWSTFGLTFWELVGHKLTR